MVQAIYTLDLNIGESYLSDWDEALAIREVIANALDETIDKDIQITEIDKNVWSIKNIGTEIKLENFILKENGKALKEGKIGKFGVGLKDALGVLCCRGYDIEIITSKYRYKPKFEFKSSYLKEKVLVVQVYENNNSEIATEVIIKKCSKDIVERAKAEFLKYVNSKVLEKNSFGEILLNEDNDYSWGYVYLNGVKISKEDKLIYSYNITLPDTQLLKGLNRERRYVSRTIFRESLKRIISNCNSKEVLEVYSHKLISSKDGSLSKELRWNDTLIRTIKYLIEEKKKIVILSNDEILEYPNYYHKLNSDNTITVIRLDKSYVTMLKKSDELKNDTIFIENFIESVELVTEDTLTEYEVYVLGRTKNVLEGLLGGDLANKIAISKNEIIPFNHGYDKIIISRSSLNTIKNCFLKVINTLSESTKYGESIKDYVLGEWCIQMDGKYKYKK